MSSNRGRYSIRLLRPVTRCRLCKRGQQCGGGEVAQLKALSSFVPHRAETGWMPVEMKCIQSRIS
jgi:hypothetical protein